MGIFEFSVGGGLWLGCDSRLFDFYQLGGRDNREQAGGGGVG